MQLCGGLLPSGRIIIAQNRALARGLARFFVQLLRLISNFKTARSLLDAACGLEDGECQLRNTKRARARAPMRAKRATLNATGKPPAIARRLDFKSEKIRSLTQNSIEAANKAAQRANSQYRKLLVSTTSKCRSTSFGCRRSFAFINSIIGSM